MWGNKVHSSDLDLYFDQGRSLARASKRQSVHLTTAQRQELESMLRRTKLAVGLARRARAILLLSQGHTISAVGRLVAMRRRHIYKWIDRFHEQGIARLTDEKRTGRTPVFSLRVRDASGQVRRE